MARLRLGQQTVRQVHEVALVNLSRLYQPPATMPAPVSTVCDKSEPSPIPEQIPDEVMAQVKSAVSQYLPGMKGAQMVYSHEHAGCTSRAHTCPTAQMGAKGVPAQLPDRQVVTLSKQIQQNSHSHRQFARLTLDAEGKLVKLVVSR